MIRFLKITIFGSKRGHLTVEWHYVVPEYELEMPWFWDYLWDRFLYDAKERVFETDFTGRTWEAINEWDQWPDGLDPAFRPRERYLKLVSS